MRIPSFNTVRQQRMSAFQIESRIQLLVDFGFALDLAELILNTNTPDARMIAFAKQLQNIEEVQEGEKGARERVLHEMSPA